MAIAVIGAGRVGTALAVLLEGAGHRIVGASGREASRHRVERYLPTTPFLPPAQAAGMAEVVILGVVDDLIEQACTDLVRAGGLAQGQTVVHLSGSMGLGALHEADEAGAQSLSLHPLQSFPDVDEGIARLPGSGVAVTAHHEGIAELGERLARDVGGFPFRLADEVKPLYHSAAVFGANYLVTVEAVAERLLRLAGITDPLPLLAPLARTAFERTLALGAQAALTGPAVRGDAGTIGRNMAALSARAPEMVDAYAALARVAARIAEGSGALSAEDRRRLEEELDRWR
jgi:predicted short-subunit dehydrogenase-like oxidoreductase (DUF2520 family)